MIKKYIFLSIAIITAAFSQAQQLTGFDTEIEEGVDSLLSKYIEYSSFSIDGATINPFYIEEYVKLFSNGSSSYVYNDIEPQQISGEKISVDDYTSIVKLNYKGGLSVSMNIKRVQLSEAYTFKKAKNYIVNAEVSKKVFGLFQGTKIHDITQSLTFQIVFDTKSGQPANFRIFEINTPESSYDIAQAKEEKLAIGLVAAPCYTMINSANIKSGTGWTSAGAISVSGGLDVSYQFSPGLSVKTGIHYSSFQSTNKAEITDFKSTTTFTDIDNDTYSKVINSNLEEINTLSFVEIPVQFKYTLKPKAKVSYYAYGGVSFAYLLSAKYNVKGNASVKGFYKDYSVTLENIEEYGFTSNNYDDTGDWALNQINFFGNIGFGISFKTGYKSRLNIGPMAKLSLTDLKYAEAKYSDDFLNTQGEAGSTMAMSFGLAVSLMMF